MKIVRHIARDMRQALRAIRERLGEDAVILSSRRVGDGVEVTAAIDFDAASLEGEQAHNTGQPVITPQTRSEVPAFREEVPAASDELARIRGDVRAAVAASAAEASPGPAHSAAASRAHSQLVAPEVTVRSASSAPVVRGTAGYPAAVARADRAARPFQVTLPEQAAHPVQGAHPVQAGEPVQAAHAAQAPTVHAAPASDDAHLFDLPLAASAAAAEPTDVVGAELKSLRRMLETQLAQLAWNDLSRRAPVHTETLRELTELGIAHDLASQIIGQLPQDVDLTYARRFSIAALAQYLLVTGDRWLDNGGRIAFIGATGVGKTTTIAKLAVRWVLRHGPRELALVAADGVRLGAQEQMRSLGQLLGAPVYSPENFEALPVLLGELPQRLVLIDTPGSSLRDTQLSARLPVLANSASQLQTALVLAASTQAGTLEEIVKRFAPANPCCCVLTKVDEAVSLGGALSVLIRARIPVSYVSEGQRVPEDLRPARALELVSNAVRLARATGAAADEDLLRRRFGKIAHALT